MACEDGVYWDSVDFVLKVLLNSTSSAARNAV